MFKRIASNDGHQTMLSRRRRMLCGSTALCAFIVALSFAGEANAQANNWTGGDGNWSEAGRWSGDLPTGVFADPATPTPTVIGAGTAGNVTIDTNDAVSRNIQVGNGSTLQIIGGGILTTTPAQTANGINTIGLSATFNPDAAGPGTMLIDGAGSTWNAGNAGVRVGNGATGTLTLSNGGALHMTGGLLSVGLNAGGNGTLNINGGSANNVEALRLGFNGATGTVNITNAGTLVTSSSSAAQNTIGDGTGASPATGIMTISGAGSSWTIGPQGTLAIGRGAGSSGTLTITDGGKLLYQNPNGAIQVGEEGGTGEVLVSGANSLFEAAQSGLGIGTGAGSTGTFTLTDNAVANFGGVNTVIIGHHDGTGTLNVSNGATLNSENNIYVGNAGGNGTLNVTGGGKINVTAGSLDIGTQGVGTGLVDGPGSIISTSAGMTVGFVNTGALTVSNGGIVTSAGAALIGNMGGTGTLNVTSGGQFVFEREVAVGWGGGTGTALVTGAGTRMESNLAIQIGNDTGTGPSTGTLTVAEGGVIKAPTVYVGFNPAGHGTLNIGAGGAAGTVDGTVTMGGASPTINFNHNESNYIFSNVISTHAGQPVGGSVNFIGSGTTTLTAVNTYTSATNVNAGKLVIANGASIADSVLTTVNSGGTLSGAGSVGNVSVASGGTIAQSAGNTLTVKDITFAAGSIYNVGINPTGGTGSIAANSATLNGGTVQVLAGSGNYAPGTSFTILSTTGGVTGQFANAVNTNFAFLSAGLDYADPSKVNLAITRNATSFASVALTQNQRAAATGVGGLPAGNAVYDAVVQQDIGGARTAFDALSGEAHASAQGALINNSLIVGDTINNRLAWGFGGETLPGAPATRAIGYAAEDAFASLNYADDKRGAAKAPWMARKAPVVAPPPAVIYSLWAQGLGSWLNHSGDGNAAKMKSSTAGVISGLDVTFWDTYRFGIAGGYSQSDISVGARGASLDADSYHISVYGGARQGRFGFQGGLIYSWNEIASNRAVMFPGFMDTVRADYNAGTTHLFGETNYQFLVNGTALQTFAGFNYMHHQTDSFAERGGAAALAVTSNDRDVVFTTVGLRSSAMLAQSGTFTLVGRGTLGWRHAFGDTDTAISAAFAGGSPFSVTGTPIATDAAYGEAGLDLNFSPAATLGIAWSGQFGNNANENRLKGQFVYRW
ncbi:autotransporter domain-containing protein [Pseudorhodoplanes sp.]|uniref:autotransporter domain-containing protein n=1 Tax=Pseudorhodoplanes sp. TaxID=1934341 RepID=UPI002B6733AF|nr:autotransporter domain-containing protein [Pseudorhodoplanes sp.]HWV51691.1 autotransporter domain-containing protein [Pseudorhodoplanes sp.]